jgi:hypothetical protein
MPTDPYVPPDPADRPRQQQNLPPGLALPPARGWRPTRPGDQRAPSVAGGALRGAPGPNVGYAYTLANGAKERFRLAEHEHTDDVVAVVAEIAGKRAAAFGRAPVIRDVDVAVALLGYDGTADDDFVAVRRLLVHDAAHGYARRRELVDTVPEPLLRATPEELGAGIAQWRSSARDLLTGRGR